MDLHASANPSIAYRVPFEIERRADAGSLVLRNTGDEPLVGVRLQLDGPGIMAASLPQRLSPGGALEIRVRGGDLSSNTLLVLRWFRLDGQEFLWRVAF